ncbi:MAG: FAD-dependent oxidoreductase [Bacillota bacterium]|nr:FAD-dependent oxidoreductase [Bacillota bacterium]
MKKYAHVLSPIKIGNVEVKNRIELAPAMPCLATPGGHVTGELIAFYRSMARGGAGIVTIGESSIDFEYAKTHDHMLNLGDESVVAGLSVLAEAVHRYGSKISIEINHGGRTLLNGREAIAPSPIPTRGEEVMAAMEGRRPIKVTEMDQEMIHTVVNRFADAVDRCARAGFEMVMIHGAHGHLIAQFLSPYANKRRDNYGGSLENRARFAIEVLSAIRKKVGDKIAIEYRISASELVPEGMKEEETIEFVKMIEDKIDLLHVSVGLLSDPVTLPHQIQPTYFPHNYNVHYAEKFKKALRVPITTVGSISDLESADRIIGEGKADVVAMARAIYADPDIVNKSRRGEQNKVRPCLRCHTCNFYAGNLLPIRCAVNPVLGRELEYDKIPQAVEKKKIVVVGGGPAGMEAALVASSRGHEVVLYEKNKKLGGNLNFAAGPPFKEDMKKYLQWLIGQVEEAPRLEIRLNSSADAATVKADNPDAVIVAAGSEPILPHIEGEEKNKTIWVGDVHLNKGIPGQRAVIVGGGLTGCEAALHLAREGKNVTIIDMQDETELDTSEPPILKRGTGLMDMLNDLGVSFLTGVKLEKINKNGAVVIDKKWNNYVIPADTIVLSLGFKPRSNIADELKYTARDVYIIGDCRSPKRIKEAIHDGFNTAVEI